MANDIINRAYVIKPSQKVGFRELPGFEHVEIDLGRVACLEKPWKPLAIALCFSSTWLLTHVL